MQERAAYDFFYNLKWPSGFVCPRCGFKGAYTIATRRLPLYQCMVCNHQTTLTAGTIMENTRTPLYKWMIAVRLMSQPNSVNAVQLKSILDVTYKTAFSMLKKIRMALTEVDRRFRLSGQVHAVCRYAWGEALPVCRDSKRLPVIAGGSFERDEALSYAKMKPGQRLIGHTSYGMMRFRDAHVDPACRSFEYPRSHLHRLHPVLEELAARVFRWIGRKFRGVSAKYMEHYLDEFSFRVNGATRRASIESAIGRCIVRNAETPMPVMSAAAA